MIQVAHIGLHCRRLWFMIVDTFQSLNESYLLFHIPMRFLMVHFICGFSLSTNKWLSFFATGDWYDRSNICSHFQGIAWQVTFRQPFSIIRVFLHFTKYMSWNNRDEDWKNVNSLFKRHFCCRRRPCNLRIQPFLLTLRRWGRFARRNFCASATEIPYWRRKICPKSGQELWLVDGVVILFTKD